MDEKEGQEIYFKQFIQRQETLLLDFLRKNIDLEIRASALSQSLKEITAKYEESQKQVAVQNDLMQQAATGVESLTIEKKRFEQKEAELSKTVEDLKRSLQECKYEREQITIQHNELVNKTKDFDKRYDDLSAEYKRQTEELGKIYAENEELSSKITINKKKPKATLPSDEF